MLFFNFDIDTDGGREVAANLVCFMFLKTLLPLLLDG